MATDVYEAPSSFIIRSDSSPLVPGTQKISSADSFDADDEEGAFGKEESDGLVYDEDWGLSWE